MTGTGVVQKLRSDRDTSHPTRASAAATGAFDPAHSDLDFLVTFEDLAAGELSDAYFGLLEDLDGRFQRPVDLVVETTSSPTLQNQ